MKERPMLFSGPMVRAILDGRKTQTRRVVRPQPPENTIRMYAEESPDFSFATDRWYAEYLNQGRKWTDGALFRCPYGQPGDRLWVRENWATMYCFDGAAPSEIPQGVPIWCCDTDVDEPTGCGDDKGKTRPSIFMPRWASRLTLEITKIRVERLQAISEADAKAEGCDAGYVKADPIGFENGTYQYLHTPMDYRTGYHRLWGSINGKSHPWDSNPWVWVIEFKVLQAPTHLISERIPAEAAHG